MKAQSSFGIGRTATRTAIVMLTLAAISPVAPVRADDKKAGKDVTSAAGWKELFNGKDTSGWMSRDGKEPGKGWVVENGELARKQKSGDIWTKARFGDFVLQLEFKTKGNSGVFIRTDDPRKNVQTGIEIQVDNPGGPGRHSVGALYDLVAPNKNVGKKDWNKLAVTCKGSVISVNLNGEKIAEMNLDKWTEPQKNPDGSKNKFKTALKDFKREGHVGLQDHGAEVRYRNIRIRELR